MLVVAAPQETVGGLVASSQSTLLHGLAPLAHVAVVVTGTEVAEQGVAGAGHVTVEAGMAAAGLALRAAFLAVGSSRRHPLAIGALVDGEPAQGSLDRSRNRGCHRSGRRPLLPPPVRLPKAPAAPPPAPMAMKAALEAISEVLTASSRPLACSASTGSSVWVSSISRSRSVMTGFSTGMSESILSASR